MILQSLLITVDNAGPPGDAGAETVAISGPASPAAVRPRSPTACAGPLPRAWRRVALPAGAPCRRRIRAASACIFAQK